jgi:hypothetical protein
MANNNNVVHVVKVIMPIVLSLVNFIVLALVGLDECAINKPNTINQFSLFFLILSQWISSQLPH